MWRQMRPFHKQKETRMWCASELFLYFSHLSFENISTHFWHTTPEHFASASIQVVARVKAAAPGLAKLSFPATISLHIKEHLMHKLDINSWLIIWPSIVKSNISFQILHISDEKTQSLHMSFLPLWPTPLGKISLIHLSFNDPPFKLDSSRRNLSLWSRTRESSITRDEPLAITIWREATYEYRARIGLLIINVYNSCEDFLVIWSHHRNDIWVQKFHWGQQVEQRMLTRVNFRRQV